MTPDQRIDDLEFRLVRYHEWLVASIEQRDRLGIDAAWGVAGVVNSLVAAGLVVWLMYSFLGVDSTLKQIAIGLAAWSAHVAMTIYTNDKRMKEIDRFSSLPDWEWNPR